MVNYKGPFMIGGWNALASEAPPLSARYVVARSTQLPRASPKSKGSCVEAQWPWWLVDWNSLSYWQAAAPFLWCISMFKTLKVRQMFWLSRMIALQANKIIYTCTCRLVDPKILPFGDVTKHHQMSLKVFHLIYGSITIETTELRWTETVCFFFL